MKIKVILYENCVFYVLTHTKMNQHGADCRVIRVGFKILKILIRLLMDQESAKFHLDF